jgi:hypothetical protein
MKSKFKRSLLYLGVSYGYYGLLRLTVEHLPESNAIAGIVWSIPFLLILFVLCYKAFYDSFRNSLLLSIFAFVASFSGFFTLLMVTPEQSLLDNPDLLGSLYFLIALTLPVPLCYAVWYADKYIGSRKKK